MKLSEYLQIPGNTQIDLANKVCLSQSMISQLANGLRPVPITTCVLIEQATNGQVTRKDLRPDDWLQIWPELGDERRLSPDRRANRRSKKS